METGVTDRPPPSKHPPPTDIEYALDLEDYVACHMYLRYGHGAPSPRPRSLRASDLLIGAVCFLGIAVLIGTRPANVSLFVAALLAALCLLVFAVALAVRGAPEGPSGPLKGLMEEVQKLQALGAIRSGRRDQLHIDREGYTEISEYRDEGAGVAVFERKESRVSWSAVYEIVVAERHAIFTVTAKGYVFVPRRAFANESEFIAFVANAVWLRHFHRRPGKGEITLGPVERPDGRLQTPP